jgi:hypothetical protein
MPVIPYYRGRPAQFWIDTLAPRRTRAQVPAQPSKRRRQDVDRPRIDWRSGSRTSAPTPVTVSREEKKEMSGTGNPYADTSSMYIVHIMFRREFALLPDLIGSVAPGDGQRTQVVGDHVELMCSLLHHHHSAEDAVLWPLLLIRAPKEIDPVVHLAEGHHQAIDDLLSEVGKRLEAWRDGASTADGAALALSLRRLAVKAFEHMDLEERLVLPLVERYIFATEWEAMEVQAVSSLSPDEVPLVVGMVMYEVKREQLPEAFPAPVVEMAPGVYAAYAERVFGTKTPLRATELAIGTPLVGAASEVTAA